MDPTTFKTADDFADQVAEALDEVFESPASAKLRAILAEMANALDSRLQVNLTCILDVFDEQKASPLPLHSTGLAASHGQEPYRTWNDSTPQRCLVEGEIQVVPNDRCPRCWGTWDFKLQHRTCQHCHAVLGRDCKLLLDSDVCPFCEKGKVTMANPKCDRCGIEIDPSIAAWG
jgi:hypothetical protein